MNQFMQHLQIKHKLIIIMSTVIFTLLLVGSVLVISERYFARESMLDKLMMVSSIIADRSTAALSFDDPKVAIEVLSTLNHESSVVPGCIYDNSQTLFAAHARVIPVQPLATPSNSEASISENTSNSRLSSLPSDTSAGWPSFQER